MNVRGTTERAQRRFKPPIPVAGAMLLLAGAVLAVAGFMARADASDDLQRARNALPGQRTDTTQAESAAEEIAATLREWEGAATELGSIGSQAVTATKDLLTAAGKEADIAGKMIDSEVAGDSGSWNSLVAQAGAQADRANVLLHRVEALLGNMPALPDSPPAQPTANARS